MKPKPAQESWYRVAICLHEFGQRLVAPRLQILEIFRVIGAEPHHHGKVADLGRGGTDTKRKKATRQKQRRYNKLQQKELSICLAVLSTEKPVT